MCKKFIYSISFIMLLGVTSSVCAALESFSIPPAHDAHVGNDAQLGPDRCEGVTWSAMYFRDISVRRRVSFVSYDILELKGAQSYFSDVCFSNYGWDVGIALVYGVIEELDNIDEATITWNNAPGVQNDPTPPLSDPVALDYNDLTPLLYTFTSPPRDVRESTEPNQALADFLNSDTDGTVTFMFAPPEGQNDGIVRTKELMGAGTYLQGLYLPPPEAIKPTPANGQIDVRRDVVLSWRPGIYADKHDVYFGIDFNDVNQASRDNPLDVLVSQNQEDTSYDPPSLLEFNQTYYWRVDEFNDVNPDSPWKGQIWSFTVGNFVVVDDFEAYDADENQIWFTWKDGFGYGMPGTPNYYAGNGTGSAVGDENSPTYMELNNVYAGEQSCPFMYNNTSVPMYSEIVREWEAPQDWTADDVVTLTLWFNGDTLNSAEPLYVEVEDSAGKSSIVTHPDATAVQLGGWELGDWQQWDIALSQLSDAGVDLIAVKKMYIGVGNKSAPQMGGTGSLLFDEIRLYRLDVE